jgi:geranylgeranyl diphosphate synthase type I
MLIQSQIQELPRRRQGQRLHENRPSKQGASDAWRRTIPEAQVAGYMAAIEQELRDILGYPRPAATDFWYMLYYHMGWEHIDQPPVRGGKRLRPLLTLLCAAAAGGDWLQALPFAASVELLHNFALVHDDIQDASPLRRGRATLWARWGVAQAINAGDALFTYAHLAMHRAVCLPQATRLAALALLEQTCLALSMGQHLDMACATRSGVTVTDYMAMIAGKTACLLATAAEFGTLAVSVAEEVRAHYHAFAHHLGLMFQIRDDILGIWGTQEATGKPVDTDLTRRKKTLPVLYGLEHSVAFRQAFQAPQGTEVDVPTLTRLLEDSGARGAAEAEVQRHARLALQHLAAARPRDEEAGRVLRQLTHTLIERTE